MKKTKQLREWVGDFGDSYTERNIVDWQNRLAAFGVMLADVHLDRILEVGCNRGHNLFLLAKLCKDAQLIGIEPNSRAVTIAKESTPMISVIRADAFSIPFKTDHFDLAFTANVLIHISLEDLPTALGEIHRVSRRYILAIEYFDEKETMIHYRGHDDLLWKRDFVKIYGDLFPKLALMRSGYWEKEDGFDRSHWWLFEKTG
jgi:pseudaminic acid biosynthesis-associated methylase